MTFPRLTLAGLALAAALSVPGPVRAEPLLFDALGGRAGLVALMDEFMVRLLADPRMAPHFRPANQARVKEQLVEQICEVSGGPCAYKGADMKTAHENLLVTRADFLALVEVLQDAMSARDVPFAVQNRLLARLAPMARDVITPHAERQP